jgi:hypothetical protein
MQGAPYVPLNRSVTRSDRLSAWHVKHCSAAFDVAAKATLVIVWYIFLRPGARLTDHSIYTDSVGKYTHPVSVYKNQPVNIAAICDHGTKHKFVLYENRDFLGNGLKHLFRGRTLTRFLPHSIWRTLSITHGPFCTHSCPLKFLWMSIRNKSASLQPTASMSKLKAPFATSSCEWAPA